MNIKDGFFDSVLDAHGLPIFDTEDDLHYFMRGYINFRLLFWPSIYFTDSTINNNKALRYLMFKTKENNIKYPYLPRDYGVLLSEGVFNVAVRDSLTPLNFSYELWKSQKSNKYSDIPREDYTTSIANAISNKTVIKKFSISKVSELFATKAKHFLEISLTETATTDFYNVCMQLYNNIQTKENLDFNGLLSTVVNYGYDRESCVYKKIKTGLAECYKNNIPKVLNLNTQYCFDQCAYNLEDGYSEMFTSEQLFLYDYAFDTEFLAYLPSSQIVEALKLSERAKFVTMFNGILGGNTIDRDDIYEKLERYIRQLDRLFKDYYLFTMKKELFPIKKKKDKRFAIKLYENNISRIIQLALITGTSMVDPVAGLLAGAGQLILDQFIIPNFDASENLAQYKLEAAQLFGLLSERSVIAGKPFGADMPSDHK
jgi:hypothetical protein